MQCSVSGFNLNGVIIQKGFLNLGEANLNRLQSDG